MQKRAHRLLSQCKRMFHYRATGSDTLLEIELKPQEVVHVPKGQAHAAKGITKQNADPTIIRADLQPYTKLHRFENTSQENALLSITPSQACQVIPFKLSIAHGLICNRDAFICGGNAIMFDLHEKVKPSIFATTYVLQKLRGIGSCLLLANEQYVTRQLKQGETFKVAPQHFVAAEATVRVKMHQSMYFGALYFVTCTGPGTIWIQYSTKPNYINTNVGTTTLASHDGAERVLLQEEGSLTTCSSGDGDSDSGDGGDGD